MDAAQLALIVAIAALFVGPVLLWVSGGSSRLRAALDGLVLALVSGICLLHLGPHALSQGGMVALAGIVVGLVVPALLHRVHRSGWWVGSALALLGVHAMVDGAALGLLDSSLTTGVGAAVVAHRLPVGLAISVGARRPSRAAAVLLGLAGLTGVGFAVGAGIGESLPHAVGVLIEGVIVGGLLHVVVAHPIPADERLDAASSHDHEHNHDHGHHHHHEHGHHHHHGHGDGDRRASAVGVSVGVVALAALAAVAGETPALTHLEATGRAFVSLSLTSAPALLAGFLLAGLVSAFLDPARAGWLAGGGAQSGALRGVVFGLPLPVCSCGVVPMYQSLVQRGVPVVAGLAFLVATPELGLDAVLLSVPLLGVPLTIARVVAAFAVAFVVAVLVGRWTPSIGVIGDDAPAIERGFRQRLRDGLRYGLVDLVDHTLPWILVGLLLAALAEPLLDHEVLAALPPVVQVPVAAVIGVPLYVCASGATPLAAVAVHKGVSSGAALTFLLAGPATNVTTFGVLSALHGRGLALRFGLALTVCAILVGWGVDLIGIAAPELGHPGDLHAHSYAWIGGLAAMVLLVLAGTSLWRQGARGVANQLLNPVHAH